MSLNDLYPISCPFCAISKAYPVPAPNTSPVPVSPDPEKVSPQCHLILNTPHVLAFLDILPIAPAHILLTTREHHEKISDLHIPPSTTTSQPPSSSDSQRQTSTITAQELGRYLPLLSQTLIETTGIEDWNIVQNNGARAAQVVPHIHFHLIPRYQEGRRDQFLASSNAGKGNVDVGMLKSWRMFGRGAREELDDEEAVEVARCLREGLRVVLGEEAREGGRVKL